MAYNILLNAIEINPYSIRLRKAYVLQAVGIGQSNYAQTELLKLKELISDNEYADFEKQVNGAIRDFDNFTFSSPC